MSGGEEVELTFGNGALSAVVSTTGATLRQLRRGNEALLWGSAAGEVVSDGRGQVLAPFPNRLAEGEYRFAEKSGQVPWNEPARKNAIHGLVRFLAWQIEERSTSSVRLFCPLPAQPAYPFELALSLTYRLDAKGLSVTFHAENVGAQVLPFGIGFHPYLAPGAAGLDRASLELPAAGHLLLDERGLPIGEEHLEASPSWAPLRDVVLDDCFSELGRGPDGSWRVRFSPGGAEPVVSLYGDGAFRYLMCYTADTLPVAVRRAGMAVEPMTCPPNALRSGKDLLAIEPGRSVEGTWGIEVEP